MTIVNGCKRNGYQTLSTCTYRINFYDKNNFHKNFNIENDKKKEK